MTFEKRKPARNYSVAREWVRTSPLVRRKLGAQQASDFRRIARLPLVWGARLDELGATYRMLRWVAGPSDPMLADVRARRYDALAELLAGRGTNRDFERLAQAESIIAHHRAAEAPRGRK